MAESDTEWGASLEESKLDVEELPVPAARSRDETEFDDEALKVAYGEYCEQIQPILDSHHQEDGTRETLYLVSDLLMCAHPWDDYYDFSHLGKHQLAEMPCTRCNKVTMVLILLGLMSSEGVEKMKKAIKKGFTCFRCVWNSAKKLYAKMDPNKHKNFLALELTTMVHANLDLSNFCRRLIGPWIEHIITELKYADCRGHIFAQAEPVWAPLVDQFFSDHRSLRRGNIRSEADPVPMSRSDRLLERKAMLDTPGLPVRPPPPHSRMTLTPMRQDRMFRNHDLFTIDPDNPNSMNKNHAPPNIVGQKRRRGWARTMRDRARAYQGAYAAEYQEFLDADPFRDRTDLATIDLDNPNVVVASDAPAALWSASDRDDWVGDVKKEAAIMQMDAALGEQVFAMYQELCDCVELGFEPGSPIPDMDESAPLGPGSQHDSEGGQGAPTADSLINAPTLSSTAEAQSEQTITTTQEPNEEEDDEDDDDLLMPIAPSLTSSSYEQRQALLAPSAATEGGTASVITVTPSLLEKIGGMMGATSAAATSAQDPVIGEKRKAVEDATGAENREAKWQKCDGL